jgi:hypothetical protein
MDLKELDWKGFTQNVPVANSCEGDSDISSPVTGGGFLD